jgi:thiol-disulfide isomerase/thioredoxin
MGKGGERMGAAMRRITLGLLVLSAVFAFAKPSEKLSLPQELQARELPWFALAAEENGTYNGVLNRDKLKETAKQRNSKRIVFSFFATWCVPCREGLKLMSEKADEFEKRGILVVLVNVGEDDYGKVNKWLGQYAKKEWLLGFDRFGNIPPEFGLAKQDADMPFPRTLIIDSNLRPLMLIGTEGNDYPQILWNANE